MDIIHLPNIVYRILWKYYNSPASTDSILFTKLIMVGFGERRYTKAEVPC
jgi:hypothetical protein